MNFPVITTTNSPTLKLPKGDFTRVPLSVRLVQSGTLTSGASLVSSLNAPRESSPPRFSWR
jgi:hypothetical protein